MIIRYSLFLILVICVCRTLAQPVQKHGPSEVYYTEDLIEGKNGRLFLSATGGVYISDDLGDHWQKMDSWINTVYFHPKFTINNHNGVLYAWDREDGIFTTADNGVNWKNEFSLLPEEDKEIRDVAIDGDTLFVGTTKGLKFFHGNEQIRFSTEIVALQNKEITDLYVDGKTVIVGTQSEGIFVSEDVGKTWANRSTGLPPAYNVRGMVILNGTIYAYSDAMGVYYSTDKGLHWSEKNTGLMLQVTKLFAEGDILYAATNSYQNVYRSNLQDGPWTLIDGGIPDGSQLNVIYASGSTLIAGGWHGVFKSIVGGDSFVPSFDGISDAFVFRNLHVGSDGSVWTVASHTGVYKMEPGETTFTPLIRENANYGSGPLIGNLLPIVQEFKLRMYDVVEKEWKDEYNYSYIPFAERFVRTESNFFISSQTNGIFRYVGTPSWQSFNQGLSSLRVTDLAQENNRVYVGTEDGLYTRVDADSQWNRISFSTPDLGVRKLFVKEDLILVTGSDYHTYRSIDGGEHWQIVEGLRSRDVSAFLQSGNIIYASSYAKLFISSNNGQDWVSRELPAVFFNSMAAGNGKLYLGTLEHGVWSTSLKSDQQITFAFVPEIVSSASTYTVTAASSSGLPITYSVISGPAIISGNVLSFSGEGDVVVRATQAGDDIFSPVSKDQTLRVALITGIEPDAITGLDVFPNPATSVLHISCESPNQGTVRLTNSAGQVIVAAVMSNRNLEIPLNNVSRGLYFLVYSNGHKTEAKKIFVK